eukprot:Opistho-2@26536
MAPVSQAVSQAEERGQAQPSPAQWQSVLMQPPLMQQVRVRPWVALQLWPPRDQRPLISRCTTPSRRVRAKCVRNASRPFSGTTAYNERGRSARNKEGCVTSNPKMQPV